MRTATTVSVCLLAGLFVLAATATPPEEEKAAPTKPSVHRLKGMKAAVADLEKGVLLLKEFPPMPYPPHYKDYIRLLASECGVDWDVVRGPVESKELREEVGGYNDIMRVEIEHRFGRGIFDKLEKQAKEGWPRDVPPTRP